MHLGCEFSVCSGGGGSCVGLSYGGKEGEVLLTLQSGAIQVYNVHDFGLVCSWQLPISEQLVCGALADPAADLYWAITSPQGLLRWSREDSTITACSSHSLGPSPDPAHLLLCQGCSVPLVVYGNGDVGLVGGANVSLAPLKWKKWALACAQVSCGGVVCVVGQGKEVSVGMVECTAGEMGQSCTTTLKGKGVNLISSCVCGDKTLLLFEEGQLWVVPLILPLQPTLISHTLPVSPPRAQLVALSSDYFLLSDAESLQVWDSAYFTCQHVTHTLFCSDSKVWCVEDCVYVSGSRGGTVRGWRVHDLTSSKLSAALGKLTCNKKQATILSSWPLVPEELKVQKDTKSSASQLYVQALVDPVQTPDLASFMTVFSSRPLTPDFCYVDILERLLLEKEFWGREALSALLRGQLVPCNVDVLSVAVSRGDWSLAEMCLTHGPTPSEQTIVSTLQKLLSLSETLRCVSGDVVSRKEILHKLFCQPFNDALMQKPLSACSLSLVEQLLLFLSEHVSVASLLAPGCDHTSLPYDMILDWIALLLDVHFTRLTLDPRCREHLLTLQAKILTQVTCYNRLSCILSLEDIQLKWTQHKSDKWLYKVETVQL